MEFREVVLKRVSIRKWKKKKVEKEKLINILEAARRAPSWSNTQPWRLIVIEEEESIKKLAEASGGQPVVEGAPVVIICAGEFGAFSRKQMMRSAKELIATGAIEVKEEELEMLLEQSAVRVAGEEAMKFRTREQITIATAYMTLAAVDQGLGTCWIGGFDAEAVQRDFRLPPQIIVHAMLALGYPGESPLPRPRKPLEEITFFGGYSKSNLE
ncbi:MAG: nitroreductase family protein [Candidatus Hodarchaeota archaeon]